MAVLLTSFLYVYFANGPAWWLPFVKQAVTQSDIKRNRKASHQPRPAASTSGTGTTDIIELGMRLGWHNRRLNGTENTFLFCQKSNSGGPSSSMHTLSGIRNHDVFSWVNISVSISMILLFSMYSTLYQHLYITLSYVLVYGWIYHEVQNAANARNAKFDIFLNLIDLH